mmetsp:Transcript_15380/g.46540  ORF Transcript_15380/g.46540 Transcript_15380/m.46540 type:complete len:205 (+) Transcript_15380:29-643(+)
MLKVLLLWTGALRAAEALHGGPATSSQVSRRQLGAAVGRVLPPAVAAIFAAAPPARGDEVFSQTTTCAKRGVLGKCLGDAEAPAPAEVKPSVGGKALPREEVLDSPLVERLRKQTADNARKNEIDVQIKSFANSQSAVVGPFSRYDFVAKSDGTFVLMTYRDKSRLEKQRRVVDGRFVNDDDARPFEISSSSSRTTAGDDEEAT